MLATFSIDSVFSGSLSACCTMSVLGDFESMRLYRKRAAEFERLADSCPLAAVRSRYRLIARHYAVLADTVERSDKARVTRRLEALKARRGPP
jgi:hypothetical protein